MPQIVAYECGMCGTLTKEIFTVSFTSSKNTFSHGNVVNQPTITLDVCKKCLPSVGEVAINALHG